MKVCKGEIYYISNPNSSVFGTEMQKDRPAVVISDNNENAENNGVTVAFLTTKPKRYSECHCTIHSSGRPATVLADQPKYVDFQRLGSYIGTATDAEIEEIDECLVKYLGIKINKYEEMLEALQNKVVDLQKNNNEKNVQISTYKDMLKGLYNEKL